MRKRYVIERLRELEQEFYDREQLMLANANALEAEGACDSAVEDLRGEARGWNRARARVKAMIDFIS